MPHDLDLMTIVKAASAFGMVLAVWAFVMLFFSSRKAQRKREVLGRLDPETNQSVVSRELRLWHEGGEATTTVYDSVDRRSPYERFVDLLRGAGIEAAPQVVLAGFTFAAMAAGAIGFMLSGRLVTGAFGIFAVLAIGWWYVGLRTSKRIGLFERQLVDALELSARALRAGHPLLGSFQLIADEIPAPVGPLFAEVCQEHELGVDLESGLRRMTNKADNADLRLFAASLSINLRTGGNLADVIDGLARVIRERMRLQRKFRVLTAQTQISKRILTGMPIIMFFVLDVLNPEYMEPLYSTTRGNVMLAVAAGMLWIGWLVMNRMAAIVR